MQWGGRPTCCRRSPRRSGSASAGPRRRPGRRRRSPRRSASSGSSPLPGVPVPALRRGGAGAVGGGRAVAGRAVHVCTSGRLRGRVERCPTATGRSARGASSVRSSVRARSRSPRAVRDGRPHRDAPDRVPLPRRRRTDSARAARAARRSRLVRRRQARPKRVAEIPGASDERVVVGAHFDSVWRGPGAIDNATGVEGLWRVAERFGGTEPAAHDRAGRVRRRRGRARRGPALHRRRARARYARSDRRHGQPRLHRLRRDQLQLLCSPAGARRARPGAASGSG